jgi:hypothetical protein
MKIAMNCGYGAIGDTADPQLLRSHPRLSKFMIGGCV